jgi:SAM-dependent methyltransferase
VAPAALAVAGLTNSPRGPAQGAQRDREIRAYWNARINDTRLSDDPPGSAGYYAAIEAYRLEKSDYLPRVVDHAAWAGQEVLEIGCGLGLDVVSFARGGARVTGVDIAAAAIEFTREYLRYAGVPAALLEADGARLPFPDDRFDLVYCMGVLPFAQDPGAIVAEAWRVLRPGGQAIFMVYNRRSWMNALAVLTGRRDGHRDAPGFHLYTRAEFERLLAPFPEQRVFAERFPAVSARHRGIAATIMNRALVPALRALPDLWWRPYGWHLLAFCRKAA